ncbi:pyridoxal phosphate-dependent transferase [Syncephalastrum racemosum]|uniref:Pyridoxal phosphate-dependent transferase n=1 Tax=Syncephalastrum racemosum TaxID=13706 RepID=A0A1X2HHE5_SYNRA|nr:pyridoxal phosphate-dependent transferase [Syncephalastrum racemosum]
MFPPRPCMPTLTLSALTLQPTSELLDRTRAKLQEYAAKSEKTAGMFAFLETAGGIHSPVMSGTPQSDFYRPLRLPTVLVGDANLGGISTTMASYESMLVRGYDIPTLLLFRNARYRNDEMLARQLPQTHVATVPAPPAMLEDPVKEQASLSAYYAQLDEALEPVIRHLDRVHNERFDRLESMAQKSKDVFWWPFTQHKTVKETTVIDSAYNDYFTTYRKDPTTGITQAKDMFDSCASWWTQGLGHANPKLTLAAAAASGRYGHVMFPEATNEPALSLAEKVLDKDKWASRVFISDNGSTALEVSLKMALKATATRYGWDNATQVDVLGIDGAYHGDTIGTMDACPPNVYNEQVQWYQPRGHWLQPPSVHISRGQTFVRVPKVMQKSADVKDTYVYPSLNDIYSVDTRGHARDSELAQVYENYIRSELESLRAKKINIGAVLMEPVIMGAGGMVFVDPLFQRVLVDTIRKDGASLLGYQRVEKPSGEKKDWQGLPVIFDEVFAGWYRLGRRSASDFLGVRPDIVGYAKTLTGGLLPLALTVTKESIFNIFLSDNKPDCLLHGHSYTAHPMGCSVANETIKNLDELARVDKVTPWTSYREDWKDNGVWSMWNKATVDKLSHLENVDNVMALGSILKVELKDEQGGYSSFISQSIIQKMRYGDFESQGINLFARPLGNVIYLMTSQITTPERVRKCEEILFDCLK